MLDEEMKGTEWDGVTEKRSKQVIKRHKKNMKQGSAE